MKKDIDVSVIIVNYKTPDLVIDCIKSISRLTEKITYEIIVVDNASQDQSCEKIRKEFEDIIIIENKQNLGFGKANNIGVKQSSGKYLFFLNSDTILKNNALFLFYTFLEQNDFVGACGCWMKNEVGNPVISAANFATLENASDEYWFLLVNKIKRKKNNYCKKYILESVQPVLNVEVVIGADLFVSRSLFLSVNGFDEDFFLYHEEMHLCYKIKEKGYNNVIIKGPDIVHLCGKSPKNKMEKNIMMDGNLFLFFYKIGVKKLSVLFKVNFFGIRILYYIKNRYTIQEIKKYLVAIRKNRFYINLNKR